MNQIIYKCLNQECKAEFKGENKEGLRCPICGSSISPFKLNPTVKELKYIFSYEQIKEKEQIHKKNEITVQITLDDTEFKKQLNSIESQMDRIITKKKLIEKHEEISLPKALELMEEMRKLFETLGYEAIFFRR